MFFNASNDAVLTSAFENDDLEVNGIAQEIGEIRRRPGQLYKVGAVG